MNSYNICSKLFGYKRCGNELKCFYFQLRLASFATDLPDTFAILTQCFSVFFYYNGWTVNQFHLWSCNFVQFAAV